MTKQTSVPSEDSDHVFSVFAVHMCKAKSDPD